MSVSPREGSVPSLWGESAICPAASPWATMSVAVVAVTVTPSISMARGTSRIDNARPASASSAISRVS